MSPKYVSTVNIALLPEPSELSYVRGVLGGTTDTQFNAINKTIVETIYSRAVMLRAIDIVSHNGGSSRSAQEPESPTMLAKAVDLARQVVASAKGFYTYVNSGSPVGQRSNQDLWVDYYRSVVTVETVEGSLVMRIRVTMEDPQAAADFANALATAYVETAGRQAADASRRISERFEQAVAAKQNELNQILDEEFSLRKRLGSLALEDQRQSLARTLEAGWEALAADIVESEQLKVRVAYSEERKRNEVQRETLQKIDDELYTTRSRLEELERRIQMRQGMNDDLQKRLTSLAESEQPFIAFKARAAAVQQEIDELRRMSVSPALSGSSVGARIKIINEALPPVYPDSPKVIRNTIAGFILALLLAGMMLVILPPLKALISRRGAVESVVDQTLMPVAVNRTETIKSVSGTGMSR
ncbi:hypothetical protein [Microvirga sp. KLBC 81]|uniref:hypothetical protein n=1 Tax=Microvirga sp. KLBC 81 TaxID=1862707 RepID=UPI00105781FD|nr:hypothetical protein [Microvirga sp. KLBC 81]